MGRPRKYLGGTEAERSRLRKQAHRARVRAANNLPPVLSPAEQRAADRREVAANVADIRNLLIKRGRTDLAEKMYPSGRRAPEAPAYNRQTRDGHS